jgi:hypothetical protein
LNPESGGIWSCTESLNDRLPIGLRVGWLCYMVPPRSRVLNPYMRPSGIETFVEVGRGQRHLKLHGPPTLLPAPTGRKKGLAQPVASPAGPNDNFGPERILGPVVGYRQNDRSAQFCPKRLATLFPYDSSSAYLEASVIDRRPTKQIYL